MRRGISAERGGHPGTARTQKMLIMNYQKCWYCSYDTKQILVR